MYEDLANGKNNPAKTKINRILKIVNPMDPNSFKYEILYNFDINAF